MNLAQRLDRAAARADELRAMLSEGRGGEAFSKASRELAELEPVVERVAALRAAEAARAEAEALLADPEMKELAEAELDELRARFGMTLIVGAPDLSDPWMRRLSAMVDANLLVLKAGETRAQLTRSLGVESLTGERLQAASRALRDEFREGAAAHRVIQVRARRHAARPPSCVDPR